MVIAFQIILVIVIVLSFLGAMGSDKKEVSTNMALICISGMTAFVATVFFSINF